MVDDEGLVLQIARSILERSGFRVLQAIDGVQCLETFKERAAEIDVVLLDMTMPSMSGEEVMRELQKISPAVQVVLSTGYTEAEANLRFAGYQLAGFLKKPYRSAQLASTIQALVPAR